MRHSHANRNVRGQAEKALSRMPFYPFRRAQIAVAAMVLTEGLLLVKRAVDPEKGKWALPAGYLDLGETPREGVAREVLERRNSGKVES